MMLQTIERYACVCHGCWCLCVCQSLLREYRALCTSFSFFLNWLLIVNIKTHRIYHVQLFSSRTIEINGSGYRRCIACAVLAYARNAFDNYCECYFVECLRNLKMLTYTAMTLAATASSQPLLGQIKSISIVT